MYASKLAMLSRGKICDDHDDHPNYEEPEPAQLSIVTIDPSCEPEGKQTADRANNQKVGHPYLAGCHVNCTDRMRQRTKLSGH